MATYRKGEIPLVQHPRQIPAIARGIVHGLPIGFQVMAPALHEDSLFRVAAEVERLANFTARPALATSEVMPA